MHDRQRIFVCPSTSQEQTADKQERNTWRPPHPNALTLDHCVVALLRIADALQRAVRKLFVVTVRNAARRIRTAVAQVHVVHVHRRSSWIRMCFVMCPAMSAALKDCALVLNCGETASVLPCACRVLCTLCCPRCAFLVLLGLCDRHSHLCRGTEEGSIFSRFMCAAQCPIVYSKLVDCFEFGFVLVVRELCVGFFFVIREQSWWGV